MARLIGLREEMNLTFEPVTADRWNDFEVLFGERGACGGCWCMHWRQTGPEFKRNKGAANKRAIKKIVMSGEVPGLLAYDSGDPVAWCSVGPRERYPRLIRSRTLKPIDDLPVWSIVCLYVRKSHRSLGVSAQMLSAVAEYVGLQGGTIVEGYPYEPKTKWADAFLYTGTTSAFRRAGFKKVAQTSATRSIMRKRTDK